MSDEDTLEEKQSLGSFLRTHREEKGASLSEASEATKISLPILQAMEEGAHDRMPADAFCRGFYSLYASYLELDPQEILDRYEAAKDPEQRAPKKPAKPPGKKSQSLTNYAEPASISSATSKGLLTIICLALLVGLCWYFNWNPLNYINNTIVTPITALQTEQDSPVMQQETVASPEPATEADADFPETEPSPEPTDQPTAMEVVSASGSPDQLNDAELDIDADPFEAGTQTAAAPPVAAPYQLEIYFGNSGTLKVTLDDGFVLNKHFNEGETLQWEVEKKIILDMPESINGTLRLNGIEIPLPDAENGRRMLSLPEDLLD